MGQPHQERKWSVRCDRKVTVDHKDFDLSYWDGVPEKDLGKARNQKKPFMKKPRALGHISFEVPVSQPSEMLGWQSGIINNTW